MIKFTQLILIGLVLSTSLCTIKPKAPFKKGSILEGDYFYSDLGNYFDFSQAKYPITVNGQGAIANNQTAAYVEKHFQLYNFEQLNWVKQLNNDSVVYCFDDRHLIVQVMNGEGKVFGYYEKVDFKAANVICLDAIEYRHREFIYVGCVSKNTGVDPGSVYILTWNLRTKNITHVEITKQDDGFQIKNRLQMFVTTVETTEEDEQTDFLVLYDQGNTNSMVHRGNDNVRLYRNLEIGNLKYFKLLSVDAANFEIVYDYFPYDHTVLLSGRLSGPTETIITLTQCTINSKDETLQCNSAKNKGTTVQRGKIGITYDGNYFQIDEVSKSMYIASLSGPFIAPDWNRNIIRQMNNLDLHNDLEHAYLRFFNGNSEVAVINYGTLSGVDFGYTGISFRSGISWKREEIAACNIGRSIVYGNTNQTKGHQEDVVSLMRPTEPYVLIPSELLQPGKNTIAIEVSDSESPSPASVSTIFTKAKDMYDGEIKVKDLFGDITIQGGTSQFVSMSNSAIEQGNALEVKITSDTGLVHGVGVGGVAVKIKWVPNHDHHDIEHYAFDGRKALVQTVSGKVYFYSCNRVDLETHTCYQYASYPLQETAQPFRDFMDYKDTVFTWTCDSKECYVLVAQDDGDVSKVTLSHDTKSVWYSQNPKDDLQMRLYATDGQTVKIWVGPRHEPEGLYLWYTITHDNSGQDFFCPTQVTHCPDSVDVMEILNDCEGQNQKILKFDISGTKAQFYEYVNLDRIMYHPFFCPMGSEFIIGSTKTFDNNRVYSINTHDDLNYWSIPQNLTAQNWHYSCLQRDRRFVMYAYEGDATVQASVLIGNRGSSQLTRFPIVVPGLKVAIAHAYPSFDGIMHWFDVDGDHLFFVTFDAPKLELNANKVTQETKVNASFEFTNGNGRNKYVMQKQITVTP